MIPLKTCSCIPVILAIFLLFFLPSCKKEDINQLTHAQLVGDWTLVKEEERWRFSDWGDWKTKFHPKCFLSRKYRFTQDKKVLLIKDPSDCEVGNSSSLKEGDWDLDLENKRFIIWQTFGNNRRPLLYEFVNISEGRLFLKANHQTVGSNINFQVLLTFVK